MVVAGDAVVAVDAVVAGDEAVVVRLGGSSYVISMECVAEVGRPPALTRVPGMPSWVAGVANWRGRVLAVVDVRPLLGAPSVDLDRRGRLAVLHRAGVAVGLLVEAVEGTRLLPADALQPPPANLPAAAAALLEGQVSSPDGPCGVLDLAALFRLPDALPRARRAG